MDDQTLDERHITPEGSPSPFLPGTNIQFAWDSTSLGLFKTCPRLYQYIMLEGWSGKEESIHLRFGAEYHAALEHFDHRIALGDSREDALSSTVHSILARTMDWQVSGNEKALKYKSRENLFQLVIDYIDHFSPDPAKTVIKSDGEPAVELSFRFELDYGPNSQYPMTLDAQAQAEAPEPQPYLLCGHLDRVVSFNSQLLVMDRKTTTSTPGPYYFASYSPNNQMSLYTLAGKIIMSAPITGVIIDAAQIKLEEPNVFSRGFTFRTEAQLDEWRQDLRTMLALAETYALNNYFPMNDTSCDKFGGCQFRGICSKDPNVRPAFLKSDFIQLPEDQRWNPLKAR